MKTYIHETVESCTKYSIKMGGTLDEFNTADYADTYGGGKRLLSRFQPNMFVRIENVGDADIINPRLAIENRRKWFSADDMLDAVIRDDMSDAEKAMAIFNHCSSIEVQAHDNNRRVGPPFPAEGDEHENRILSHPSRNDFKERANPVIAANCYYCSGCSLSAANFTILCRHAELPARAVWMCPQDTFTTHCVSEVWYDGGWHLFDPERRSFYLREDNCTIASYYDLHKNPSLAERTVDGGFASEGKPSHAPEYQKFYPPHVMPVDQWLSEMSMRLRPGETLLWQWENNGKYRYGNNIRGRSHLTPYQLSNGKLIYRPRLDPPVCLRNNPGHNNIVPYKYDNDCNGYALRPECKGHTASIIYRIHSPYPIVGANVKADVMLSAAGDTARLRLSVRDSDWQEVWTAPKAGRSACNIALDDLIDPVPHPAIREFYLLFELKAKGRPECVFLNNIEIETEFQMSATALPSLSAGENEVEYRSDSAPGARARITHCWRESDQFTPPEPPPAPKSPENGEMIDPRGLNHLAWQAPQARSEGGLQDYHVQLGTKPDMLSPLSPNFDRLTFSNKPRFHVPTGWLNPETVYYWRVRARNEDGVWSRWSRVWSFSTE